MSSPKPLGRVKGILIEKLDGSLGFRFYEKGGTFTDYSIRHSDLSIEIDDTDAYVYEENGMKYIDYSPKSLGKDEKATPVRKSGAW